MDNRKVLKCTIFYFLVSLSAASVQAWAATCSPANYTKITNTGPLPVDFCAYTELPFRTLLPETPQNIDATNTQILRINYIQNSAQTHSIDRREMWVGGEMPDATGPGACDSTVTYCHGDNGSPVWIASASDPLVTINCVNTGYGCSNALLNNAMVSTLPAFHLPANYRPSEDGTGGADGGGEIIQPNGDAIIIYHCWPSRNFQNGDVLGATSGGPCPNGVGSAHYTNVVTANGINPGTVSGGDDAAALPAHFYEVQNGQIDHALVTIADCFTGTVYPGFGAGQCANGDGIPSGSHIWLSLTRAQIDSLISNGTEPAAMRPFLYAMHEYGIYVFDSFGSGGTPGLSQPWLEDPVPEIINGAPNPWVPWFIANGGGLSGDGLYKHWNGIDWVPLQNSLSVVSSCYAQGTCSDSVRSFTPSKDGTRVPPAASITDNSGNVWTLRADQATLINGVQADSGAGSVILWYQSTIYTLGLDANWWQWTGTTWTNIGPKDPSSSSFSACDMNGDAATNVSDVQVAVNQALGTLTCVPFGQAGSADINQDGKCTVVDVQRVVNAALGGQCVSP